MPSVTVQKRVGGDNAATPPPTPTSYSGNGVFVVGTEPSEGLRAIPPGRYTVHIAQGKSEGYVMRCRSVLCGVEYSQNTINVVNGLGAEYVSVVELEPTDAAVNLLNVVLTPVG